MVKWSGPARMDLKKIHDYIANDSRYYAKKVVQTIVERTEELTIFHKRWYTSILMLTSYGIYNRIL